MCVCVLCLTDCARAHTQIPFQCICILVLSCWQHTHSSASNTKSNTTQRRAETRRCCVLCDWCTLCVLDMRGLAISRTRHRVSEYACGCTRIRYDHYTLAGTRTRERIEKWFERDFSVVGLVVWWCRCCAERARYVSGRRALTGCGRSRNGRSDQFSSVRRCCWINLFFLLSVYLIL